MKKKLTSKDKKIITIVVAIIVIVIGICTQNDKVLKYVEKNYDIDLSVFSSVDEKNKKDEKSDTSKFNEYEVVRVVDGDTIIIDYNGKNEKVRLIGVDTPESVHPDETRNTKEGIKTSNYTKERLNGKKVKIELDVQERDKYGRILAYVYIDGKMYNKELLEKGYAKLATYPPNVKYVDDFKEIEKKARENKIGLWE